MMPLMVDDDAINGDVLGMMMVVVVVMMALMVGDDALNSDVVGDDDGGGRGALLGHLQVSGSVGARHVISAKFAKIYIFNTDSVPVWILCQIICNRLAARIALQPRYGAA